LSLKLERDEASRAHTASRRVLEQSMQRLERLIVARNRLFLQAFELRPLKPPLRQVPVHVLRQEHAARLERDHGLVANRRGHLRSEVFAQGNELIGRDRELVQAEARLCVIGQIKLRTPVRDPEQGGHALARDAILGKTDESDGDVHRRLQHLLHDEPRVERLVTRPGFLDNAPRELVKKTVHIGGLMQREESARGA
jgi:hypothetical protein